MTSRLSPSGGAGPEPEDGDFEEVTRARDQGEALVIQGLLEAHGIRVLVRTHVAHSVHPFSVGGQGEVRILVPRARAADGRRLLLRLAAG